MKGKLGLGSCLKDYSLFLFRSSNMTGENEQKWLEFLWKANQHNFDNIMKIT